METEAQARIDEEIRKLWSQRNALSPISRLPLEILASIFIRCARTYHNGSSVRTRRPKWVNVSYVCRHWREVALGCPTLWSYHFIVSSRWTEELLVRSKQALLRIRLVVTGISNSGSWWLGSLKKLMDHAERIQECTLRAPASRITDIFTQLSSCAPRLRNLKISVTGYYSSNLPSVLFDGDTPALRTLELSNIPVPRYLFKRNALTTLILHGDRAGSKQSLQEFLASLSCMQSLTHLQLHDFLSGPRKFISGAAFSTLQKISLSQLTRLQIRAPLSTVIAFLSCVIIPLRTEVILDCKPGFSSDDYVLLPSALAQRYNLSEDQKSSGSVIRSLAITFYGWRARLTLSASDCDHCSPLSESDTKLGCNTPLDILVSSGRSRLESVQELMSNICCSMPLANVERVHVTGPPVSETFWKKMLGHLRDIRYIKLKQGDMPDLAFVLSFSAHKGMENHVEHVERLVPALEELELNDIKFSLEGGCERGTCQRCLFDVLSTRGVPGGRLTMMRCSVGGSCSFSMVRSWDGLINIPVVDGAELHSHEAKEHSEDDESEDDSEDGSEYDSEDDDSEEDFDYE